ncbi:MULTISPECIES: tRNA (N(6)-L-threonylcarbamoyladenosine(37)-C(2))-methylthiotransferase MtaB [Sphingobacterium]|jgi:threonylcarbamoyladenosine tRNA methylthiotransferase MtaB|uniref:tRNA (N(6)-L-threonylcarbamoyladenosine(37)-C(2))-methylthiotransferase MtaB n=4 Tax=Sphingobacterium TaxID=28453 RepID=A0ABX7CKQ3_SPHMU|nr:MULTISPECIES: tRNA (N(6)-L-threonylcarbamoyladenosine(37)-C(2))-methylthiotransferase MtaB [Sphingobacterium]HAK30856.1 tRNA (N(6)-L-threonylcarbamoyladenosine(37)-C(2))-methylthiotransferase MtaB [Sphingobacterium sp.]APU96114.1 tRNA (N(6)-L-threonylcarbamoyladenosine(37)-C(2))-methylthiotransferase MtaB [Sphingobacterium sp. B29]MBB1645184.1 tRNA (N(6)-L-threonylcarbamoyladenosine(37)-C(2))-methylthiotransferase MtaB [Sphingobacterium sp. UME9]QMV68960.1 tRNA (N(6)-L-threonylcarbamoyladeno
MENKKVAFYTLGCKLNYSETSSIGRLFKDAGYDTTAFNSRADVYVINTCSVTDNADKKCRKVVKEALKHSPNAYITIVGCYAQLKPKEIAEIPGVDMVLGAAEKFNIIEHINDLTKQEKTIVYNGPIDETNQFVSAYSIGDRTRTFLKVQDGCDYSCTFCTIPLARGGSRSGKIEDIVRQAEEIAASGVKEIVLTGVNIGDFGIRDGKREDRFLDLVKALDEVEGIDRIRISSIEPNLLSNDIIEFVAQSKRFVPHFHMPLQSGSNKILSLMRRRYKRELYTERVAFIKSLMPNCCIGVDVIVGFPGETREDFIDTYNFLNDLDISYLHVFTYSERENTIAAQMDGAVPGAQRSDRSKMLHILSEKKRRAFYESQLGETGDVLFEADEKDGYMHGFSKNYVKVRTLYDPLLVNEVVPVKFMDVTDSCEVEVEEIPETLTH